MLSSLIYQAINIDHFPKNLKYNLIIIDIAKTSRFHMTYLKEGVILPLIPCILLTGRVKDSRKATYSAPGSKVALCSMRLLAETLNDMRKTSVS